MKTEDGKFDAWKPEPSKKPPKNYQKPTEDEVIRGRGISLLIQQAKNFVKNFPNIKEDIELMEMINKINQEVDPLFEIRGAMKEDQYEEEEKDNPLRSLNTTAQCRLCSGRFIEYFLQDHEKACA